MTCSRTAAEGALHIGGVPNPRQALFFAAREKFIAYGGARGGGKSWALRRKLAGLCLRYPGIRCLLIRRTLGELRTNHLLPMLAEYRGLVSYSEYEKRIYFPGGSAIWLGYCAADRDVLRYQGQEYDIIAVDEATQLSEYQFSIFKACLRGTGDYPRRIYLTCNPGGVGHAWVRRLFIERDYREGERAADYAFIPATVYDNGVLLRSAPDYVRQLESLPPRMRDAWLFGRWDVFEGQFFPEFDPAKHVCAPSELPRAVQRFIALDYGFDMLAVLLMGVAADGSLSVEGELCRPGLTLSEAARCAAELAVRGDAGYAVASPDLWNRRQDSGMSGFEIMQAIAGMPPMRPADDRRIPGWRVVREYLAGVDKKLRISSACPELIRCLPALLFDKNRPEDAADEPHSVTHAPEALRYALMSRVPCVCEREEEFANFRFERRHGSPLWE